jgi:hypothetical protein
MDPYKTRKVKLLGEFAEQLRQDLPPMIARKKADWFTGGRVSPKSLANEDKLGKGPGKRVLIGGEVCYPRDEFVAYLLSKNVEVIDVPVL